MKKLILSIGILFCHCSIFCQSQEVQQLLLDVEKLAQFKQILSDLKKGYDILSKGYTTIKNISEGNFNLHQTFLDGLLQVSSTVRRYERVVDVVNYQMRIVKEYRSAYSHFRSDVNFTTKEIEYIGKTYTNLLKRSVDNLNDLMTILTAGSLRMSDEERLSAIDNIWKEIQNQYGFLHEFNNSTAILSMARVREQQEIGISRKLQGIR